MPQKFAVSRWQAIAGLVALIASAGVAVWSTADDVDDWFENADAMHAEHPQMQADIATINAWIVAQKAANDLEEARLEGERRVRETACRDNEWSRSTCRRFGLQGGYPE